MTKNMIDIRLYDRINSVNDQYFHFDELPVIRWSKGRIQKKYRKLTFGTYHIKKNEIRIHPILKNSNIPPIVLDFIIFHELLHYEDRESLRFRMTNPFRGKKRREVHGSQFHSREKDFATRKEALKIMTDIVKGHFQLN